MTVLEWLQQPAGRKSIYPLLVLVGAGGLCGGFAFGQLDGKASVEERVQIVTSTHEVKVQSKALTRNIYVKTTTQPNGAKVEERSEVLVEKVDTTTKADAASSSTTTVKTERKPDWRVGVLVGATWKEPALVIAGPLVLGAQVERRILGPFSVGLWATTQGAGGASLSGEF